MEKYGMERDQKDDPELSPVHLGRVKATRTKSDSCVLKQSE